jgi:hypothetical protein
VRSALVTALCACARRRQRNEARKFLQGLSADELQYIAEFLGACILEPPAGCASTRAQLAESISRFEQARRQEHTPASSLCACDCDHKMILLLEYVCRSGIQQVPAAASAGRA